MTAPRYSEHYSTLEFVPPPQPSHVESLQSGNLQVYQPPLLESKTANSEVQSVNQSKSLWGFSRRTIWLVTVVICLLVVGGVAGGVVSGLKKRKGTKVSVESSTPASTTSSSIYVSTISTASTSKTSSTPPSSTSTASFSSTSWYRLTNAYTGPSLSLDVVNDNGSSSTGIIQMAGTGKYSGQYWKFQPTGKNYYMSTSFLGEDMRLDISSDDPITPHLAPSSKSDGQVWSATSWGDGTWMLTNKYNGNTLHLDTYSDTKVPFMGDGDHTGQHWTVVVIDS